MNEEYKNLLDGLNRKQLNYEKILTIKNIDNMCDDDVIEIVLYIQDKIKDLIFNLKDYEN